VVVSWVPDSVVRTAQDEVVAKLRAENERLQKDLKRAQESGDFSLRRDLTTVKSALMESETKGNASEVTKLLVRPV